MRGSAFKPFGPARPSPGFTGTQPIGFRPSEPPMRA
jgi:hypothetical protein